MFKTVTVRDTVFGEGSVKICVPLVASDLKGLRAGLDGLTGVPYDMVEWRYDYFIASEQTDESTLRSALEMIGEVIGKAPLLFTIRTAAEGGLAKISAEEYRRFNIRAAETELTDMHDVELCSYGDELAQSLTHKLQQLGKKVVGSSHDFSKTPVESEITERLVRMQSCGMDITKMAVMPQSEEDVMVLLQASVKMKKGLADRPFVTMSMGRLGVISRLCGALDGSAFTFGTAGEASAPGQIPAVQLKEILEVLG